MGPVSKLVPASLQYPTTHLQELKPGLGFILAFANVTAIRTDDGVVLIDCSGLPNGRHLLVCMVVD